MRPIGLMLLLAGGCGSSGGYHPPAGTDDGGAAADAQAADDAKTAGDLTLAGPPDFTAPPPDFKTSPPPDLTAPVTLPDLTTHLPDLPKPVDFAQGDGQFQCNSLDPGPAPMAVANQVAQSPPAPLGGVVADGKYYLGKVTIYTGPNGMTGPLGGAVQEAILLAGGHMDIAARISNMDVRSSGTFSFANKMFVYGATCPTVGMAQSNGYTYTDPHFYVFAPSGGDTSVADFVRQ